MECISRWANLLSTVGAFFGVSALVYQELLLSIVITVFVFIYGVIIFTKVEKNYYLREHKVFFWM